MPLPASAWASSLRKKPELIALNIGLSSGLLSTRLFSVLVVMAVLTTLMTAPLLSLIRPRTAVPQADRASVASAAGGT